MNKKTLFRLLSAVLCVIILPFGIVMFYDKVTNDPVVFDSTFKVSIAAIIWGVILLVMIVRGK